MPGPETPDQDPRALTGDLFDNLPSPTVQAPSVDNEPPAPGSRRARREAATGSEPSTPDHNSDAETRVSPPQATSPSSESVLGASAQSTSGQSGSAPASSVQRTSVLSDSTSDAPAAGASTARAAAPSERPARPTPAVAAEAPVRSGTLDDLFQAETHDSDHGAPGARGKKKRRTGCLVALIIVLVILGGATAGGVWAWNTYGDKISDTLGWGEPKDWEAGIATGEVQVTIVAGDTGQSVSKTLFDAGVTKTEDVVYDYMIEEAVAVTFQPGVYQLQEKMTAAAALDALRDPANKLENTVSIPEGGTIESSLPAITDSIGIPLEELVAATSDPSVYGVTATTLEGWLFPAVYTFDPGATATDVIQRMVDRTRESLTAAGVPAGDENRVLTIASIIQREGRVAEFDKVSRVIQNRLDDGMMLQMDSTAQYGFGELHAGVVSTSEEAQHDDNAWNTYVVPGLPVGPIANPSDAAIDAAMHPADGPWFYFVTINPSTGETVFSVTYEEHQRGIAQWGEWCKANPDQGC